jgi:hypothetical protein
MTATRARLAAVLGMAAAGLGLGCYSPNIKNGGLTCAADGACPSGFSCVAGSNVCVRPDAGLDLVAPRDAARETSSDRPAIGDGATEMVCVQPVAGCTPQSTTMCDPVCQTLCGCTEKCSVKHNATIACLPLLGQRATWDTCDITSYDSDVQNDTCQPGDICLQPGGSGGTTRGCFQLCRTDDDCAALGTMAADAAAGGAAPPCVLRPVGTAPPNFAPPMARVCDVPYATCDPTPTTNSGCPLTRPDCYLVSPDPVTKADRTICEFGSGTLGNMQACSNPRDCFKGWTCPIGDNLPEAGVCHPACNVAAPNCPPASKGCMPYGTNFGYCL